MVGEVRWPPWCAHRQPCTADSRAKLRSIVTRPTVVRIADDIGSQSRLMRVGPLGLAIDGTQLRPLLQQRSRLGMLRVYSPDPYWLRVWHGLCALVWPSVLTFLLVLYA